MTDTTPEQRQEILQLLNEGRKIDAIRIYREATGHDLASANRFIEQLQTAIESGNADHVGDGQVNRDEIERLLKSGEKIAAIKLYRDSTGAGLKEAKDAVEDIGESVGIPRPKGCGAVVLAFVVLLSLLTLT